PRRAERQRIQLSRCQLGGGDRRRRSGASQRAENHPVVQGLFRCPASVFRRRRLRELHDGGRPGTSPGGVSRQLRSAGRDQVQVRSKKPLPGESESTSSRYASLESTCRVVRSVRLSRTSRGGHYVLLSASPLRHPSKRVAPMTNTLRNNPKPDPALHQGAVEGNDPSGEGSGNPSAPGIDADGLPNDEIATAEDRIGANIDDPELENAVERA